MLEFFGICQQVGNRSSVMSQLQELFTVHFARRLDLNVVKTTETINLRRFWKWVGEDLMGV